MDKDVQANLVADVAGLKTDMSWVKTMLGNHYKHQWALVMALVVGLLGLVGSLIIVLVSR